MEIYIITLFLIFIFGILDLNIRLTEIQRNSIIIFLCIFIVVQIGLRWETGTDWKPYLENFDKTEDFSILLINAVTGIEIGYGFFVLSIKTIFNNYSFFLFIHAIIFYSTIFIFAKKYSPNIFATIIIFYSTTLGLVGSNRQLLALVFCLLSLIFVFKKKLLPFFLLVIIASLFHTTAIIFGIYYFLNRNFKKLHILLILLICFIVGNTNLPFMFFSKFGGIFGELATSKTMAYTEGAKNNLEESSLSVFGLIKRLIFILLFTLNYSFLSKKLFYYKVFYNGYVFGLVLYFLFSSSLLILVNRGSLYFNIMESFLISCQFLLFYKSTDKTILYFILFLISIILIFQSISAYPDLFNPYKSLFYNTDFNRALY